jgi:mannose-1-phosphate guanylyltransferase / mannose-6-phosphate isomerase
MFCFKAGVILDELARHAPDVARTAEACWAAMRDGGVDQASMLEIPAEAFAEVPDISIDYAVMEKSTMSPSFPATSAGATSVPGTPSANWSSRTSTTTAPSARRS